VRGGTIGRNKPIGTFPSDLSQHLTDSAQCIWTLALVHTDL
jgi:hypothetical protein